MLSFEDGFEPVGHQARPGSIRIGGTAGWRFLGQADLQVVKHCWAGKRHGLYFSRKRIADWAAFNYDPKLGWEIDHWFEWDDENGRG
jgi:hypothetical protein